MGFIVRCIRGGVDFDEEDEDEDLEEKGENNGENGRGENALALSIACVQVGLEDGALVWEAGKRREVELRSFGYVATAVCLREVERHGGIIA